MNTRGQERGGLRTVTVNLNRRCPLSCAHCSLGFSEQNRGDRWRLERGQLERVVQSVDPDVYRILLMAGGEPSLELRLVAAGVRACARAGLLSGVVTAPIWARTLDRARGFVDAAAGLDMLVLSYDRYHLEQIDHEHYHNAVAAAAARGVSVVIHMTCSGAKEERRLTESLGGMRLFVSQVNAVPTVAVGNAATTAKDGRGVTVDRPGDLEKVPRRCVAGNAYVDEEGGVHGCCWATTTKGSPLSVSAVNGDTSAAFRRLEGSRRFQRVRRHGFLGALDSEARGALASLARGRTVSCECDVCILAMRRPEHDVWRALSRGGGGRA